MLVLITDDERNIRESLKKYLGLEGIDSLCAETGEDAVRLLKQESFDAVILDLKLPGMSGQEVLDWMRDRGIPAPVVMISAHGQIPDAVAALKTGARDYLVKPFDPAELLVRLRQLVDDKRRENLLEAEKRIADPGGLIGRTEAMRRLSARIDRIAASDVTVLITGESGTGKEVAAREIHRRSPQASEPFVAVNIGGIHEGLMESELFGHEKGAFTGAAARKQGLFELAGRGVIFLDEVGEMPPPLQVKLLRVLQERKIRRLGGSIDIPVGARIVSATNRDIEALVRDGRFREDLYYRINVFRLALPPLRERGEDIPLLAEHLLHKLSVRMSRPVPSVSPEAVEKLRGYSFPGNIRELENILERALIYGGGKEIRPGDIDIRRDAGAANTAAEGGEPGGTGSAGSGNFVSGSIASLEELEKRAVREALARHRGNRTRAAEELGISRKTIINKVKAYGLE
ncbi:MAG: sigma-54 dependent transcriptional regulator [Treponema sp.]|jgi:two-component system response regulator AtoC|nr:sigma-54 dependent transcriptional regulator [Treponema sp.]